VDKLDSWYLPGGCRVEKFRLPSPIWACTPFSGTAPEFLFSRGTSYIITGKAGDIFYRYHYIPEPAENGKRKIDGILLLGSLKFIAFQSDT
jgi:hypothetical protein